MPIRGGVICCRDAIMRRGSLRGCRSGLAAMPAATARRACHRPRGARRRPAPIGHCCVANALPTSAGRAFLGLLTSSGLTCTFLASCEHAEGALNLIEVDGFVPTADPRIVDFRARLGAALHRLLPFGGYAVPLPAAVAVPDRAKG